MWIMIQATLVNADFMQFAWENETTKEVIIQCLYAGRDDNELNFWRTKCGN
jgi:hypothetical protein